jgi:hypothetical protein
MSFIYIDESIHTNGNFILCALVYSENNPNELIEQAINDVNLSPSIAEFKSGINTNIHPEQILLRNKLFSIIHKCKIALSISNLSDRNTLYIDVLSLLEKTISVNSLFNVQTNIYIDQGIFKTNFLLSASSPLKEWNVIFHPSVDSKKIKGIQLADLIAHCCSSMLLEQLGLLSKEVVVYDYLRDSEIKQMLSYELWGQLRYLFFQGDVPNRPELSQLGYTNVDNYGLYVSPKCNPNLQKAFLDKFGSNYLGCIH